MEQNVFLTKVISIVIAAVVAAVVLVPICDSIADNGGSSGGGSDDGRMIVNSGNLYYQTMGSTTNYRYDFENVDEMGEYDMPMNRTEVKVGEQTFLFKPYWTSENSFDCVFYPMFTFTTADGRTGMEGICFGVFTDEMDTTYWSMYAGAVYVRLICGMSEPESYSLLYVVEQPQYEVLSSTYIQVSNGNITYGFGLPFTQLAGAKYNLCLCPTEEDADYVTTISEDMECTPFVYEDTLFYVALCHYNVSLIVDDDTGDAYIEGSDAGGLWMNKGTVATNPGREGSFCYGFDTSSFEGAPISVYSDDESDEEWGDYYTLMGVSVGDDLYGGVFIVPLEVKEGGSGGSSDTGVTGTLIKTIPIFVILGIILGSVALFYQNRNGL